MSEVDRLTVEVENLKEEVAQLRTADDWVDGERIRLMGELRAERSRHGQNLDAAVNLIVCAHRYEARSFLCAGWRRMALARSTHREALRLALIEAGKYLDKLSAREWDRRNMPTLWAAELNGLLAVIAEALGVAERGQS